MKAGWRVRRIATGSAIVRKRLGRAFVPLDNDGEIRLIASGIRIAGGLALGNGALTLAHQSSIWLIGGTCAWCWAAWRASAENAPAAEKAAPDVEPQPWTDEQVHQHLDKLIPELIGDRRGVHLRTVLARLQEDGALPGTTTAAALGRDLECRGYTVRASLKVAGQVLPGLHRDDLPAAAQPLPDRTRALAG